MALALPHVRRVPSRHSSAASPFRPSTAPLDNDANNKIHRSPRSSRGFKLAAAIGTSVVFLGGMASRDTSARQSRDVTSSMSATSTSTTPRASNKAVPIRIPPAVPHDDPTNPPFGAELFTRTGTTTGSAGEGDLCTRSKPCLLLHPVADLSNHIPDEALDASVSAEGKGRLSSGLDLQYGHDNSNQGDDVSSAVLTRRGAGIGHEINQDRAFILRFNDNTKGSTSDFVMGLADGHGDLGHYTSHYFAMQMPELLTKELSAKASDDEVAIKKILTDSFLTVDANVDAFASSRDLSMSGCTAIVALKRGGRLYFANAGDSLAFVVVRDPSSGKIDIVYRTKPHKPNLPEERARVEGLGGEILMPPAWATLDSPRVLQKLTVEEEMNGVSPIALAMSRSIGDRQLKSIGVIADPTVDVIDITSLSKSSQQGNHKEVFVVATSDGLFEQVEPEQLAEHIAKALYDKSSASSPPLLSAMDNLVMSGSSSWSQLMAGSEPYRDDISISVAKVY